MERCGNGGCVGRDLDRESLREVVMRLEIAGVEVIPIAVPLVRPLKMAVATVHHRDSLLVRIHTRDGPVGLGEAVLAPYFTGETQAGARYCLERLLAPCLVGMDALDLHAALTRMDRALWGNPAAKAAVDVALHDLVARALEVPLYALLGGRMRPRVDSTWYLFGQGCEELADETVQGVEQGYRAVKLKLGTAPPSLDLQRLQAVRRAAGDEVEIRADANQAWTPDEAIRFLHAAHDLGLQFIEQPVHRGDLLGAARVAGAVDTPIALDEGLFNAGDALHCIRAGAARGAVVKLIKTAGLAGARQLAAVLQAANLPAHLAGMPGETSISSAAALHLAVALPQLQWGAGIYPSFAQLDVVTEPLRPLHGTYVPPEAPGLGVTLDDQAVDHCRTDR